MVVTGDIGTGKTTLCRAILEQLDRRTFTALVLNPFLSEEDLLKLILHDFGVVSRDEVKRGRLAGVSKQDLIDTLNEFLLSLLPIGARALLIIDEAQNLPPQVLEQIRILSNLETDKEKLLQVVLVGQLNLHTLLRSPDMRQLDQRVSIRYQLNPLTREETAGYVAHRLQVAGSGAVTFLPKAVDLVHRYSGGTPRLINLLCDRALLGGYAIRTSRIPAEVVVKAAETLDLRRRRAGWVARARRLAGALTAGAVASMLVGVTAAGVVGQTRWRLAFERPAVTPAAVSQAGVPAGTVGIVAPPWDAPPAPWPARAAILVGSFLEPARASSIRLQLEQLGYRANQVEVTQAGDASWRVWVGGYDDPAEARRDESRLKAIPGFEAARLLFAADASPDRPSTAASVPGEDRRRP